MGKINRTGRKVHLFSRVSFLFSFEKRFSYMILDAVEVMSHLSVSLGWWDYGCALSRLATWLDNFSPPLSNKCKYKETKERSLKPPSPSLSLDLIWPVALMVGIPVRKGKPVHTKPGQMLTHVTQSRAHPANSSAEKHHTTCNIVLTWLSKTLSWGACCYSACRVPKGCPGLWWYLWGIRMRWVSHLVLRSFGC